MSDQVDVVAEAIAEEADDYYWHLLTPDEREPYYKRARAAIAALKLTEERGVQIPGDPIRHLNLDQSFGDYSPSWGRFTRLVSPWVRKDNTNE